MAGQDKTGEEGVGEGVGAISIIQRGNLKSLEKTLRKQWRLGQNMVLCWSADERGLLVILVPHYFLGNYCALESGADGAADNEAFVRELISDGRRKTREEMFAVSRRLDVAPTFIKLGAPLSDEEGVQNAVEQLIRRYGLGYVDSRAVLLFDIVEFSLFTPFEQASQLNSLSYSLNSAYNKLLSRGIEVNFARTTTGDGYYVWNRKLGAEANRDLFTFMLLVVADNAVARAASRGNTVPVVRTAYHVGGHYELYQAEGVNPSVFSYIVGDVTIELARMVDLAQGEQILVGDFQAARENNSLTSSPVATPEFVSSCNRALDAAVGVQLSGKVVKSLSCKLTGHADDADAPRRFRIIDKHGLSRHAYNLELGIEFEDSRLNLGLDAARLTAREDENTAGQAETHAPSEAASAGEMIDDLAALLQKRSASRIVED